MNELPQAGTWTIDSAHSAVSFKARHLGVGRVRGRFTDFSGTITVAGDPLASSVEVEIDAASITTGVGQRDDHLRSADFFDVAEYPALRYRSTGIERTGDDSFVLHGELTIRDVTRPVDLDVTFDGLAPGVDGNGLIAFTASAEVDREEFGLTWNQAIEAGGVLIGRKVRLDLEVEAARAVAKAA